MNKIQKTFLEELKKVEEKDIIPHIVILGEKEYLELKREPTFMEDIFPDVNHEDKLQRFYYGLKVIVNKNKKGIEIK